MGTYIKLISITISNYSVPLIKYDMVTYKQFWTVRYIINVSVWVKTAIH